MQVSSYRLPTVDYRLQTVDYRLQKQIHRQMQVQSNRGSCFESWIHDMKLLGLLSGIIFESGQKAPQGSSKKIAVAEIEKYM